MAIVTALTEAFGLEYPLILAPMGGVSGGRLAAAVSNAGALGLVGGGYADDPEWLNRELKLAKDGTDRIWGVGFITWHLKSEMLALALEYRPPVVLLSFADPAPYVPAIRAAGARLICQVQDVPGAEAARVEGADLIVAQGTEAGGHGAIRATLPLVPAVVDAVAPTPVVAAGGIADGRGVAAALALGAQGAMVGTRFYAAAEALGHENAKARLVAGKASETRRTRVFDVVRQYSWPEGYTGRALRNRFMQEWEGREAELAAQPDRKAVFLAAQRVGDVDTAMVWAGEGIDLIDRVESAADLVRRLGVEAEGVLRRVGQLLR